MKKSPNKIFEDYMNSISMGDYLATQEALAKFCGVSVSVVRFWKNGRTRIKPAYQKLITEFVGKEIF
jgi:Helix-turn-helix.